MTTRFPVGRKISLPSALRALPLSRAEAARFHGEPARVDHRAAAGHAHRCGEPIEKPHMRLVSASEASIACASTDGGVNRLFARIARTGGSPHPVMLAFWSRF